MIILLAIAISPIPSSPANDRALAVCRAKLQRRIDVSAIEAASIRKSGRLTVIRGNVTALVGMGDPGPGFAKAHHLIRESYQFKCSVRSNHVTAISVSPVD